MPLPLILIGFALFTSGYGIKKGIDAKEDFGKAERVNNNAQKLYEKAQSDLESARKSSQDSLDKLGKKKFSLYEKSIIPFAKAYTQIKNIDFEDKGVIDKLEFPLANAENMRAVEAVALKMEEVVKGGITALGSGGLAGLAAYGGVGVLGTASTGASIAGLSGVAATNATLAWLGGGSLAAGGFGMAGGAAVLGGIVAGPVLAVGGMMMASKAEAAKEDAYSNLSKAEAAAAQMETASTAAKGLQRRFDELTDVLNSLNHYFEPLLFNLECLVERSKNYQQYNEDERKELFITFSLAKTIKNIMDTPVIDNNGVITKESRRILQDGREMLEKL